MCIPQFVEDGSFDPAALRAYLARAEVLGFEGAWVQEQVLGSMPNMGSLETLAFATACTERLRLGCAVLITTLHSPVHLAKSISTLDQMSRGRIEVGVGDGREADVLRVRGRPRQLHRPIHRRSGPHEGAVDPAGASTASSGLRT